MLSWKVLVDIFGFFVIVYYSIFFLKCIIFRRKYSKLLPGKGFSSLNVLGNILEFPLRKSSRNGYPAVAYALQYLAGFTEMSRTEKLFCCWFGFTPIVVLIKAEAVQDLLREAKSLRKPARFYELLQPLLGTGLLTSKVEKWKCNRKLLNPCFHGGILKDFVSMFDRHARKLVQLLQKETDKDFTEISTPITLCSLDIINEAVLGIRLDDLNISGYENITAIKRSEKYIVEKFMNCWKWRGPLKFIAKLLPLHEEYDAALNRFKWMKQFTKTVFEKKKAEFVSGNLPEKIQKSFLDLLLEIHLHTEGFTAEDVVDELDTLLAAGHETTAVSICWTLYLIGLHTDVQQNVQEELDFIFGDEKERAVTLEDMRDFKYLDCVIKESQRLYPAIPLFMRELEKDAIIGGYALPEGTICAVSAYSVHRDREVFPVPEKFDPERFFPENFAKIPPLAYIPFSSGPRDCIGKNYAMLAEKVIVSTILRNFSIESLDPRDTLMPLTEVTIHPYNPIRLKLRPRFK